MNTTTIHSFPATSHTVSGILRKLLLVIVLFLPSPACFAQNADDGETLYVYTKGNDEAALYNLDEMNKITFSNKGVQLWNTDWPTEYPYKNISVLSFRKRNQGGAPTGISEKSGGGKISIGYNASKWIVTVMSDVLLDGVTVYDLQGQPISSYTNERQVYSLSLQDVPKGVYIVKAYGKKSESTKKIVKP